MSGRDGERERARARAREKEGEREMTVAPCPLLGSSFSNALGQLQGGVYSGVVIKAN